MSHEPSVDGTAVDSPDEPSTVRDGPVVDTTYMRRLMHDLSAPTRHVSIFSEFVDEALTEPLDLDDARRSLATVRTAAVRMQQLTLMVSLHMKMIERLHATAKNPRARFQAEPYSVAEVITESWGSIGGRGDALTIQGDAKTSVDETLLLVPLEQLLRNALGFQKESRPLQVLVSIQPTDELISVSIEDNGIGVDTKYAEKICEPFECLGTGKERRDGAGLGLAVSTLVIKELGGSFQIESDGESGTKVTMSWPHHCNAGDSGVE
ncbi:ATP-binding protein [Rhodopirellula sp. P2]|uniref:ATP-binding protein n=1 Tax=Rhodopirellula sp. P2 TaxID=2127060 RepID=UPI0023681FA9|nr:HAMP domain-containing sensor histidine kinase [Rhodopirellula sp. P2]WDQ15970.1 HAMP domain-containing sensor histidine kinase [Rhodopirellula sp. P2]